GVQGYSSECDMPELQEMGGSGISSEDTTEICRGSEE
ncbi:hypothetical protein AVEN_272589-1, partial [Araneus ventricosus]